MEPSNPPDARRPTERELELTVEDGFALAAVGDCITSRPLAPALDRDLGFAAVVELLRGADATFGNLETSIVDIRGFSGHPSAARDDWGLRALPAVAEDLRALGFDLLSRANNHATDWGIEGLRETGRWLDEAGLVHAGAGENLASARAPRYFETPKGRVGLVSMTSSPSSELSTALDQFGEVPGRPGLNPLRVERVVVVPPDVMDTVRRLREALPDAVTEWEPKPPPDEIGLFGSRFRLGESLDVHHEMNRDDLLGNLRSIRQGKQNADLLVATIHAHQEIAERDRPAEFLRELAREAIDAGADEFIVHGIHRTGPVEVYGGRPIFYGLGDFVWSDLQEPFQGYLYEQSRGLLAAAFEDPSGATDADVTAVNAGYWGELVFQGVLAVTSFAGGRAEEIRLHPVELGHGERLTRSGVPRAAPPATGAAILERLASISKPHGTSIAIDGGVGVITPGR